VKWEIRGQRGSGTFGTEERLLRPDLKIFRFLKYVNVLHFPHVYTLVPLLFCLLNVFFFLQKVNQLQNEGGSDVFTSNRHSPLRQSDTAHRYKNNVVAVN
jgi:hypothetical protein